MSAGSRRSGTRRPRTGSRRGVVLIGFMGSGKTEVGRRLAERMDRPFIDTDELVEADAGAIPDVFAAEGEAGFRRREAAAIRAAAGRDGAVIATGGGAVLDPDNVERLRKAGDIVFLDVDATVLAQRLAQTEGRPLLDGVADLTERVHALLEKRRSTYVDAADHVIRCSGLGPEGVTVAVQSAIRKGGGGRVHVGTDPAYEVHVGRGILDGLTDLVPWPEACERALVITHPRIKRLWAAGVTEALERAGLGVSVATFPQGEDHKTDEAVAALHRRCASERLHRSDVIVCLGGGVVGDVGGFVASTYARGVAFVQVPTTLLAMVDAAIGGKTGFNLPEGKNLVGTFAQPLGVVCDLDVLATLPEREFRGGLAEVVKYSLIADPSLGELLVSRCDELDASSDALEETVLRSAAIKADVVAADEKEGGVRAYLNYGHTLGHALEAIGWRRGGRTLHHGEAIAVGMVFAAWVSVLLGTAEEELVDEHERRFDAVGLRTRVPAMGWDDLAPYLQLDKKYRRGLRLVLLEDLGRPVVRGDLPVDVLKEALRRVSGG